MLKLPESPAWLTTKGCDEAARRALESINGTTDDTYVTDSQGGGGILPSFGRDSSTYDRAFWLLRRRNYTTRNYHSKSPEQTGIERVNSNSPLREIDVELDETISSSVTSKNHSEGNGHLNSKEEELILSQQSRHENIRSFAGSCIRKLGYKLQAAALTISRYRQQTYIALFLAVGQQFCGQTNILNYAPLIFSEAMKQDVENGSNANDDNDSSEGAKDMSMVIIGLVKFLLTALVILRIEYIGRRLLLIFGNFLIAVGLLALVVAFGGSNNATNMDSDATHWSPMTNIKSFNLALPGVLLVVSGYSMSFGPLTWLLTSELFPTEIRGRAMGYSSIITHLCAAISAQTFLFAQSILGPSFVFGMYCIITTTGAIFAFMAIPDTGGKTVEQIDESLKKMSWWKYSSMALSQNDEEIVPGMNSSRSETVRSTPLEVSEHGST